jgi:hypothetical protein
LKATYNLERLPAWLWWYVWSGPPGKTGGARVHHDHQAKEYHVYYARNINSLAVKTLTRKTLVLSNHNPGTGEDGLGIRCPETSNISDFPLLDDAIYEIDEATGNIDFAWYPCEHFVEMGFDAAAKEGIKNYYSVDPEKLIFQDRLYSVDAAARF